MVDICQQLDHPTVQGIVNGLMNVYSCVAGMLLDGLLGYSIFETTAFEKWHIQELHFEHTALLYFV
jgi:hypothetical protein